MDAPSDLVTAIVQAIEIDYILEQSIISKLARRDVNTVEILCKDNGPLGTLFSKIGLGYALGLFNEEEMEYLNAIRRIRIAFAHTRKDISFATPLVQSELASLTFPKQTSKLYKSIDLVRRLTNPKVMASMPEPALTGRAAYVILCMALVHYLRGTEYNW